MKSSVPAWEAACMEPITGNCGCCARAATGHPAAAAPSSVMNSRRRIIRSPRRPARAELVGCRAERVGGFEIDDKVKIRRLLDRNVGRACAAQNFVTEFSGAAEKTREVGSIGHQTSRNHELSNGVRRGE